MDKRKYFLIHKKGKCEPQVAYPYTKICILQGRCFSNFCRYTLLKCCKSLFVMTKQVKISLLSQVRGHEKSVDTRTNV